MVTSRIRRMRKVEWIGITGMNEDGSSVPESSGNKGDDGGGRAPAAAVRPLSLSRGVPRES